MTSVLLQRGEASSCHYGGATEHRLGEGQRAAPLQEDSRAEGEEEEDVERNRWQRQWLRLPV